MHIDIVESGMEEKLSFYKSNGVEEKRAILLRLDKYLAPYYNFQLDDSEKIFKWLESLLSKPSELKLKKDIFQLIQSYSELGYEDCEILDNGDISYNGYNKAK